MPAYVLAVPRLGTVNVYCQPKVWGWVLLVTSGCIITGYGVQLAQAAQHDPVDDPAGLQ